MNQRLSGKPCMHHGCREDLRRSRPGAVLFFGARPKAQRSFRKLFNFLAIRLSKIKDQTTAKLKTNKDKDHLMNDANDAKGTGLCRSLVGAGFYEEKGSIADT
jgi:hypothetical protein